MVDFSQDVRWEYTEGPSIGSYVQVALQHLISSYLSILLCLLIGAVTLFVAACAQAKDFSRNSHQHHNVCVCVCVCVQLLRANKMCGEEDDAKFTLQQWLRRV